MAVWDLHLQKFQTLCRLPWGVFSFVVMLLPVKVPPGTVQKTQRTSNESEQCCQASLSQEICSSVSTVGQNRPLPPDLMRRSRLILFLVEVTDFVAGVPWRCWQHIFNKSVWSYELYCNYANNLIHYHIIHCVGTGSILSERLWSRGQPGPSGVDEQWFVWGTRENASMGQKLQMSGTLEASP